MPRYVVRHDSEGVWDEMTIRKDDYIMDKYNMPLLDMGGSNMRKYVDGWLPNDNSDGAWGTLSSFHTYLLSAYYVPDTVFLPQTYFQQLGNSESMSFFIS